MRQDSIHNIKTIQKTHPVLADTLAKMYQKFETMGYEKEREYYKFLRSVEEHIQEMYEQASFVPENVSERTRRTVNDCVYEVVVDAYENGMELAKTEYMDEMEASDEYL